MEETSATGSESDLEAPVVRLSSHLVVGVGSGMVATVAVVVASLFVPGLDLDDGAASEGVNLAGVVYAVGGVAGALYGIAGLYFPSAKPLRGGLMAAIAGSGLTYLLIAGLGLDAGSGSRAMVEAFVVTALLGLLVVMLFGFVWSGINRWPRWSHLVVLATYLLISRSGLEAISTRLEPRYWVGLAAQGLILVLLAFHGWSKRHPVGHPLPEKRRRQGLTLIGFLAAIGIAMLFGS